MCFHQLKQKRKSGSNSFRREGLQIDESATEIVGGSLKVNITYLVLIKPLSRSLRWEQRTQESKQSNNRATDRHSILCCGINVQLAALGSFDWSRLSPGCIPDNCSLTSNEILLLDNEY